MFKGLIDNYRWEAHARMCARRGDLNIVFEKGTPKPRTNYKTMYLPAPSQMTSPTERVKLLHFVNHESSHHEYGSDFDIITEDKTMDPASSFKGEIWNAYEDDRVDYNVTNEWDGVRENYDEFYTLFMPELITAHTKLQRDHSFPKEFKDQQSSLTYTSLSNQASNIIAIRLALEEYRAILSPEALEYVARYEQGDYRDRIFNAPEGKEGSRVIADVAKDVYRDVYLLTDQEPEKQPKKQASNNKAEEKSKVEKEEKGEGDGESKGEGEKDGEGKSNEKDKGEKKAKEEEVGELEQLTDKERMKRKFGNINLRPDNHKEHGFKRDAWDTMKRFDPPATAGTFHPDPASKIQVINYENNTSINCPFDKDPIATTPHQPESLRRRVRELSARHSGQKLANVIRRLLQIRSRKRWSYGKKKGKLSGKSLHRLMVPGNTPYSQRIFKQRGEALVLDSAVQLLIDCSGSMRSNKIAHAIVSTDLLCDTISRSLRIPIELLGFTGKSTTRIAVYKTFDVPVSSQILQERMIQSTDSMTFNADGEAIAWAYTRLMRRKEKRKLMIVLSDGQPALGGCYRSGDIKTYTREVIKEIEDKSPVDIIGIGFLDASVKEFYNHNVIIQHANELEDALLTIIKTKILDGDIR